ncbi:dephospho-CoA kinase, partial [Acinetobacter baumannii]|uniref:dephospho-CoA kinase n=1 Tax=Acinetobacter baumannii TaxID=470 RepID=UPI001CB86CEE
QLQNRKSPYVILVSPLLFETNQHELVNHTLLIDASEQTQIQRLGAFKTGSIVTLAPFIAAILAVPLLGESLSPSIVVGLVG